MNFNYVPGFINTLSIAVILLTSLLRTSDVRSQDVHFTDDLYLGNFQQEAALPKLKLRLRQGTASGILIENRNGTAHTWIPYTDGSIYLTGDRTGGRTGHVIFRNYDESGYHNRLRIDGATGQMRFYNLASNSPAATARLIYGDALGNVLKDAAPEVYSINPSSFNSDVPEFAANSSYATIKKMGSSERIYAPVNLPNGVQIIGFSVEFIDDYALQEVGCRLVRSPISSSLFQNVASSSTSGSPGRVVVDDNIFNNPVIDNINYSYYLEGYPLSTWSDGSFNARMEINNIVIKYVYQQD